MAVGPWTHNTVGQITILGTYATNRIANVFNFEASEVEEGLMLNDELATEWISELLTDFRTTLETLWLACLPSGYAIESYRGQVVERPGNVAHRLGAVEISPAGTGAGTGGATISSTMACAVIRWKSTSASRSCRGRTYVGPLQSAWETGSLLQAAGKTALEAFADGMLGRYKVITGTNQAAHFSVYSRPLEHVYSIRRLAGVPTVTDRGSYDGNITNVTSRQVDTILRSQRRRELGVGQ